MTGWKGPTTTTENIITAVADRLDKDAKVPNPVDKDENLNRLSTEASTDLKARLREFEDTARRANAATSEETAAEIWTEAFEHFFPMPEDVDGEDDAEASSGYRRGEEHRAVAHSFDPQIRIRAVSKDNGNYVREGINSIPTIVKNCSIDFELLNAEQLPAGASVRWTVRNCGHDAWSKNDIGHLSGDGHTADEHSAYNGNHAMDLTVYQWGRIIGRRRVEINVRGAVMPARNLPTKRIFRRR